MLPKQKSALRAVHSNKRIGFSLRCVRFSRSGSRLRCRRCNRKTNTSEVVKSVASTSEEKVSSIYIPNDIVFPILSKLPVKSLKRFGCVCKSWSLLFEQDSYFMNIYRNNFISRYHSYYNDTSLLLQHYSLFDDDQVPATLYLLSGERLENKEKIDFSLPLQELQNDFVIVGSASINGILCLTNYNSVVLWNPFTREFKIIPPMPIESLPNQFPCVFCHGFGYDHVKNDYKVITYVNFTQSHNHHPTWHLYSLRSNSWKELDVDMPSSPEDIDEAGLVYMDGMCHWWGVMGIRQPPSDVLVGVSCLVSFDLRDEVFFTTLMPLDMNDNFDFEVVRYLVVLNGSIALISYYEEDMTTIHISILGEIGVKESWIKLFTIGPLSCVERPIGAGKNGVIFFVMEDGELVWFDLSTQMIEKLGVKGLDERILIYKKSLLPIGGGGVGSLS